MSNLRGERRVPPFMLHNEESVYPDTSTIIDRSKMQENSIVSELDIEITFIPACVMEPSVPYSAGLGLGRERYFYLIRPLNLIRGVLIFTFIIESKLPYTVKRFPV